MRSHLKNHKRIVIKIGSAMLTHENGKINLKRIEELSWVLAELCNQGKEIILVSSGAMAVGIDRLQMKERPSDIKLKQAAAAVGQGILMQIYENFFMRYNQIVAQVLLTGHILHDEKMNLNALNTFETLFSMNVIPIVNENDTVAVEEFGFSENDNLSAYVAYLTKSDCLIILSDIKGLYDCDPKKNKNASMISYVEEINSEIISLAGGTGSNFSTGGMATKISAAKMATENNIDTIISKGENPSIIFDILDGKDIGTLFIANKN